MATLFSKKNLLVLIFFLIALPFAFKTWADADLWGHTLFGVEHVRTGQIAETDPYSFTARGGRWVNHEWLTEFILGAAYEMGGSSGLFGLRVFLFLLFVSGILTLYLSRCSNVFLIFMVAGFSMPYFGYLIILRPHSFTYLLVVYWLLAFEAYRRGKRHWIYAFPPLMSLWVNFHGGFVVGLGLTGLGVLALMTGLEACEKKPDLKEKGKLAVVGVLTLLAILLNPYGLELLTYLKMALGLKREYILEWRTVSGIHLVFYLFFTIVPAITLILSKCWKRKIEIFFFAASAYVAFSNARFVILLIIFGSLVFLQSIQVLWDRYIQKDKYPTIEKLDTRLTALILLVMMLCVSGVLTFREAVASKGRVRVDATYYPVDAVKYLKKQNLGPNLALNMNWGEYAIWHLHPDYLVSNDGRYETVYPRGFVESVTKAYYEGDLEGFLQNQNANVALVGVKDKIYGAFLKASRWTEIYKDGLAAIFIPDNRSRKKITGPTLEELKSSQPVYFP